MLGVWVEVVEFEFRVRNVYATAVRAALLLFGCDDATVVGIAAGSAFTFLLAVLFRGHFTHVGDVDDVLSFVMTVHGEPLLEKDRGMRNPWFAHSGLRDWQRRRLEKCGGSRRGGELGVHVHVLDAFSGFDSWCWVW